MPPECKIFFPKCTWPEVLKNRVRSCLQVLFAKLWAFVGFRLICEREVVVKKSSQEQKQNNLTSKFLKLNDYFLKSVYNSCSNPWSNFEFAGAGHQHTIRLRRPAQTGTLTRSLEYVESYHMSSTQKSPPCFSTSEMTFRGLRRRRTFWGFWLEKQWFPYEKSCWGA